MIVLTTEAGTVVAGVRRHSEASAAAGTHAAVVITAIVDADTRAVHRAVTREVRAHAADHVAFHTAQTSVAAAVAATIHATTMHANDELVSSLVIYSIDVSISFVDL